MEGITTYIGIGAGILTGISLLPQLIKIFKEKKAEQLSFVYLIILMAGLAGWVAYGILKKDYPIIITNSFSLLVNTLLVFLSHHYNKKEKS